MIETFFDLDELVCAVEAVRGVSSLPIVALLTFDEDAETSPAASTRPPPAARLRRARRRGDRHEPRRRAARGAARARRRCATRGVPLAALPNIGLASIVGGRVVYPALDARSTSASSRRRPRRSAPASSAAAAARRPRRSSDPRGALDDGRPPRMVFEAGEIALPSALAQTPAGDRARPRPARGRVGRQRRARPAEGRHERRHDRGRAHAAGLGPRRLRRRQRQPDGPRADERADGVDRDPARGGDRDDPARHAARHDGDGPRGRPPRRARRRRAQHPRRDRRPAARRRLPGLARRLRDRLDRPRRACSRLNQGVDYVGKAIDRPTSFFTGVAVNPTADDLGARARALRAEDRRRCALRDDAGALRRRGARAAPRALGGSVPIPVLVGVWPLRSTRWRCGCTTRCRASRPGATCWSARRAGSNAPPIGLALARELSRRRATTWPAST